MDVEDLGEGGVAIYNEDGQRVTFWPWQLKNARIDWRKCEPADLDWPSRWATPTRTRPSPPFRSDMKASKDTIPNISRRTRR